MSKRIILTGASSGIGLATAFKLADQGHTLLLAARRMQQLEALATEYPDQVFAFKADVTKVDDVKAMVNEAKAKMGGIDVLINNAGLGLFDPVAEGKLEDWHYMFDVNVKGLLSCVHACLPELRAQNGLVINLGSVASHHVFPNSGVYCATKHAVLAISESLRLELGSEIRVTTISPGAVNTEFIDQTTNDKLLQDYKPYFADGLSPEIIADQIAHCINAPGSAVISEIIIRPNKTK